MKDSNKDVGKGLSVIKKALPKRQSKEVRVVREEEPVPKLKDISEYSAIPKTPDIINVKPNETYAEFIVSEGHSIYAQMEHTCSEKRRKRAFRWYMVGAIGLILSVPLSNNILEAMEDPDSRAERVFSDLPSILKADSAEHLFLPDRKDAEFYQTRLMSLIPMKSRDVIYEKGSISSPTIPVAGPDVVQVTGPNGTNSSISLRYSSYTGEGLTTKISVKGDQDNMDPFNPELLVSNFDGFDANTDRRIRNVSYYQQPFNLFDLLGHMPGRHYNKNLFVGNNISIDNKDQVASISDLPIAVEYIEKLLSGEMQGKQLKDVFNVTELPISYFTTGGHNDKVIYDQSREYIWNPVGINVFNYTDDTVFVGMIVNTNPFNEDIYLNMKEAKSEGAEYEAWKRAFDKARSNHRDNFEAVHLIFHRNKDGQFSGSLIADFTEFWSKEAVKTFQKEGEDSLIEQYALNLFPIMDINQRFWKAFVNKAYDVAVQSNHKVFFEPYLFTGNDVLGSQLERSILHKIYREYNKEVKADIPSNIKEWPSMERLYKEYGNNNPSYYENDGYIRDYIEKHENINQYAGILKVMRGISLDNR